MAWEADAVDRPRTGCDRFFLDDDDSHLMEHWKLHEDFCQLFEARIEACLTENGHKVEEFWEALTKFVDGAAETAGMEGFLLEALRAATDYRQFATTMRQMRRDRAGK